MYDKKIRIKNLGNKYNRKEVRTPKNFEKNWDVTEASIRLHTIHIFYFFLLVILTISFSLRCVDPYNVAFYCTVVKMRGTDTIPGTKVILNLFHNQLNKSNTTPGQKRGIEQKDSRVVNMIPNFDYDFDPTSLAEWLRDQDNERGNPRPNFVFIAGVNRGFYFGGYWTGGKTYMYGESTQNDDEGQSAVLYGNLRWLWNYFNALYGSTNPLNDVVASVTAHELGHQFLAAFGHWDGGEHCINSGTCLMYRDIWNGYNLNNEFCSDCMYNLARNIP